MSKSAMDIVIDLLERGRRPTDDQFKAAGLCVPCEGSGYIWPEDDADDGIPPKACRACKGTGLSGENKSSPA